MKIVYSDCKMEVAWVNLAKNNQANECKNKEHLYRYADGKEINEIITSTLMRSIGFRVLCGLQTPNTKIKKVIN